MDKRLTANGRPEWHRSEELAKELLRKLPEKYTGVTSEQDAISYAVAWFFISFHPPWPDDEEPHPES